MKRCLVCLRNLHGTNRRGVHVGVKTSERHSEVEAEWSWQLLSIAPAASWPQEPRLVWTKHYISHHPYCGESLKVVHINTNLTVNDTNPVLKTLRETQTTQNAMAAMCSKNVWPGATKTVKVPVSGTNKNQLEEHLVLFRLTFNRLVGGLGTERAVYIGWVCQT